jgi:hypothetical protein
MEGVGEHGNMACITYLDNQRDLKGLIIKADIYQNEKLLDSNVPIESIEGKNCCEMLDAKYIPNVTVNLKLSCSIYPTNNSL